jgi:hypothetical protein
MILNNKETKKCLTKILSLLNERLVMRIEAIDAPHLNLDLTDNLELKMWIKVAIKINQKEES